MSTHYAHSEGAEERVVTAILTLLETITEVNGYFITVGNVFLDLPKRSDIKRWPAFAFVQGPGKVLNTDMADQALHKSMFGTVFCFAPPEVMTAAQGKKFRANCVADIEYLLGNNWMMNVTANTPNARNVPILGSTPFHRLDDQIYVGVAVHIDLLFANDLKDPSVSV